MLVNASKRDRANPETGARDFKAGARTARANVNRRSCACARTIRKQTLLAPLSKTVTTESKHHRHPPKLANQVSNQVTSTTSTMVHQVNDFHSLLLVAIAHMKDIHSMFLFSFCLPNFYSLCGYNVREMSLHQPPHQGKSAPFQ